MIKTVDLSNDFLSSVIWCEDYHCVNGLVSRVSCTRVHIYKCSYAPTCKAQTQIIEK